MLSQYACFTSGLVFGLGLGVYKRNLRPFVAFTAIGTLGDFYYGYRFACKDLIHDFNETKKQFELNVVKIKTEDSSVNDQDNKKIDAE